MSQRNQPSLEEFWRFFDTRTRQPFRPTF
jgi:hypothetical protein